MLQNVRAIRLRYLNYSIKININFNLDCIEFYLKGSFFSLFFCNFIHCTKFFFILSFSILHTNFNELLSYSKGYNKFFKNFLTQFYNKKINKFLVEYTREAELAYFFDPNTLSKSLQVYVLNPFFTIYLLKFFVYFRLFKYYYPSHFLIPS